MDISWDDARLFLAIAEAGSVSAAAKRLKLTQPTASRRLSSLERSLGEPVFIRSVAGVRPTAFGQRLVEPARRMAEWSAELQRTAERAETAIEGLVRITAPPGLAFEVGVPFAAELHAEMPRVRIELVSTVRNVDLARREADLALRFQSVGQRDLAVLHSIDVDVVPFAAPSIARSLPKHAAVKDVPWIGWAPPLDEVPPSPQLARLLGGTPYAFTADDYLVQMRAAELGLGAILLARMRHRFRTSPLVELKLTGMPPLRASFHLVAAKSALDVPRVRAVADRLERELKRIETSRRK